MRTASAGGSWPSREEPPHVRVRRGSSSMRTAPTGGASPRGSSAARSSTTPCRRRSRRSRAGHRWRAGSRSRPSHRSCRCCRAPRPIRNQARFTAPRARAAAGARSRCRLRVAPDLVRLGFALGCVSLRLLTRRARETQSDQRPYTDPAHSPEHVSPPRITRWRFRPRSMKRNSCSDVVTNGRQGTAAERGRPERAPKRRCSAQRAIGQRRSVTGGRSEIRTRGSYRVKVVLYR